MLKMVEAGLVADPRIEPDSSPESQRLLFDAIERSADTSAVDGGRLVVQWRFADAPPWHLRIEDGSTRAEQGEAQNADVTLLSTWDDWVRLSVGNGDPRWAMLKRRLRARGSPLKLWRLQRVFPR
jgi:hypothetical protein